MKLADKTIKKEAVVTSEQVGNVLKAVAQSKVPVHKESVPQSIYLGPSVPGLSKYTVIESEQANHIKQYVKDCPEIGKLIVPVLKMAEKEGRLKTKGTLEYRQNEKVLEFANGKGEV